MRIIEKIKNIIFHAKTKSKVNSLCPNCLVSKCPNCNRVYSIPLDSVNNSENWIELLEVEENNDSE